MKKYSAVSLILAISIALSGCGSSKQKDETPNTPHELYKANKKDDAKNLFMPLADINSVDDEGNTLLHLAAAKDDSDMVLFLLIKGADPLYKNNAGDTPLHTAINNTAFNAAKLLVENGSDIFSQNADGVTALDLGLENSARYMDIFITPNTGNLLNEYGQNLVHYFVLKTAQVIEEDGSNRPKIDTKRAIDSCISKNLPLSITDVNGKTPLDIAFEIDSDDSIEIAAKLILAGADEVVTDFAYFQEAVSSRNLDMRFEDNQTPLHIASIMGHSAIAKYLLEKDADTNVQDSSGSTPLHEAVRYGNIDIIRFILDSGANINAQDNLGKTPIMVIMPKEKMNEIYKTMVSYRADLNIKDSFGDTLIHTATMMHAPSSILELLVENGADVNAKNKEGVTPFEIAIQHRDKEMTRFYANHDADIHTKDTHGISPLSLALEAEKELFEMIISEKNAQSQNSEGNTPLHIALINDAPLEKILYIISLTEDVNIRNSDGNNVLYLACTKKQEPVVKALLEKGGDIFSINKDSDSALRIALRDGGIVQDWIITSKTIKATDGSGNTCLHYAAEWKYVKAIESLVEKGANPMAKNANGENILFSAAKTNDENVINTVVKVGTPVNERDNLGSTPLHMAVRWDATKSIERLLELGIDIDAQNTSGKAALAEAALSGKMNTAKVLLDNGADVNSSDTTGCTILMDAIRGQNKDVVKLLLDYNANASIQEINGVNAYHEAARIGDIDIIKMIRDEGGNPLSRDKAGNTPFSIVMNKDMKVIKAVLGTSKNITDSDGNTPIHIAVKSKVPSKLLKELISMGYPIDGRNSNGYTALTYAVEGNDIERALILLQNKANPFQSINKKGQNAVTIALDKNNKKMIAEIVKTAGKNCDIQGNTVLHYAAKTSSTETVKDLLSFGIPKDVKNISGDTPYDVAKRWGNKEVAELLK
ncbi:MAG: ankyrin repeat domain-containing protein [Treponema sp.]|nr:ankyrin repeat domain-containing protein [Treponema sp.]